jgi:hypothetical protein
LSKNFQKIIKKKEGWNEEREREFDKLCVKVHFNTTEITAAAAAAKLIGQEKYVPAVSQRDKDTVLSATRTLAE